MYYKLNVSSTSRQNRSTFCDKQHLMPTVAIPLLSAYDTRGLSLYPSPNNSDTWRIPNLSGQFTAIKTILRQHLSPLSLQSQGTHSLLSIWQMSFNLVILYNSVQARRQSYIQVQGITTQHSIYLKLVHTDFNVYMLYHIFQGTTTYPLNR